MTSLFLQARLDSKRLPNKALLDINGETLISVVMKNLKNIDADNYILLTCSECEDIFKPICDSCGFDIFIGPKDDVLKRFVLAAEFYGSDIIIRATGDNPLVSKDLADITIDAVKYDNYDYAVVKDIPIGSSVEVFKFSSIKKADEKTKSSYDREHVCPYIYNSCDFNCAFINPPEKFKSGMSVTVDTKDDFNFIKYLMGGGVYPNLERVIKRFSTLYIPCVKKGLGTGHLLRILNIARNRGGAIYLEDKKYFFDNIYSLLDRDLTEGVEFIDFIPPKVDFVIFDNFRTSNKVFDKLNKQALFIGIDEGGAKRESFDFLIDTMPNLLKSSPNISFEDFIIEQSGGCQKSKIEKILITFGGEDLSKLTEETIKALDTSKYSVTVIKPKLRGLLYFDKNLVEVVDFVDNFKDFVLNFDLVITHFGITAFEVSSMGIPVLLKHPSSYHRKLAKKVGFLSFKNSFIPNYEDFLPLINKLKNIDLDIVEDKIPRLNLGVIPKDSKILFREDFRTFYKSKNGTVYQKVFFDKISDYSKDYFFEDYKKQYGKSYLEDFEKISNLSKSRIKIIDFFNIKGKKLLDIGCAYGPFIKVADIFGYDVQGFDICEDAVKYVVEELKLSAKCIDFSKINISDIKDRFDIITMWFVIEHFENIDDIIFKVKSILNYNGIFAFSTPNLRGVSGKRNIKKFLKNSPSDHFTIFSIKSAKKMMKKYNFEVLKVVNTGHHPERFPIFLRKLFGTKFLTLISRIFNLGDTFEIYLREKD